MCTFSFVVLTLIFCNAHLVSAYPHEQGSTDWVFNGAHGQLIVPSTVSSSFQAAGLHSCTDVLLQISLLDCRPVAVGPEVRVSQCDWASGAEGYLVLQHRRSAPAAHKRHLRTPAAPLNASRVVQALNAGFAALNTAGHADTDPVIHSKHGHEICRVRIVGAEVLVPPIQYCSSAAIARYYLSFPGSYHVEVLHLHSNFTFHNPVPLRQNLHAANFTLAVAKDSGSSAQQLPMQQPWTDKLTQRQAQLCIAGGCPVCTSHSSAGRWLVRSSQLQQQLKHTCVAFNNQGGCDWRDSTLAVEESGGLFHWQPYGCSYAPQTASSLAACRLRLQKPVCLIGDSQTRHLHNMVVKLLNSTSTGENSMKPSRLVASSHATIKSVAASDQVVYIENRWGIPMNTSNCTHVFWNFGQWPLSHLAHLDVESTNKTPERPWSLKKYSTILNDLARHMNSQKRQHGNQQYWVTINSHPIVERQKDLDDDHRTSPMVLMYNKLASSVMDMHGIEVVDTYSIADPLLDVSYDGAHYLGNVGKAQAQLLLDVICNKHLRQAAVQSSCVTSCR